MSQRVTNNIYCKLSEMCTLQSKNFSEKHWFLYTSPDSLVYISASDQAFFLCLSIETSGELSRAIKSFIYLASAPLSNRSRAYLHT